MKNFARIMQENSQDVDKSRVITVNDSKIPTNLSPREDEIIHKAWHYKNKHLRESGALRVIKAIFKLEFEPLLNKLIQKYMNLSGNYAAFQKKYPGLNIPSYRTNHIIKVFKENQVNLIYEFGSGASTYLFCELLRKYYQKTGIKGKLVSIDQSERYQKSVIEQFPEELKDFVEFRHASLKMSYKENIRFLGYDVTYDDEIDIVYFDGPTPKLIDDEIYSSQMFGHLNLLEMLENKNFKFGFTDKRQFYVLCLEPFKPHHYSINYKSHFRSFELALKS